MSDERLDPELEQEIALVEIVNRVLDRGAVIAGEVTISVAGIDLVELGLSVYLASADKAREAGLKAFPAPIPLPPGSRPPTSTGSGGDRSVSTPHPPTAEPSPADGADASEEAG